MTGTGGRSACDIDAGTADVPGVAEAARLVREGHLSPSRCWSGACVASNAKIPGYGRSTGSMRTVPDRRPGRPSAR